MQYPQPMAPLPGTSLEVAPGIFWLRFPLPFALDHVNVWLLADDDGWTLVDTGLGNERTQRVWESAFVDALQGRPIKRIVVTHYHPDHIGQAGWLARRFHAPVWITAGEWQRARRSHASSDREVGDGFRQLFGMHGLQRDRLERLAGHGNLYRQRVLELPTETRRIAAGETLKINGDVWRVYVGRGHAPEHACLYREHDQVLISGDQVLPRISSNVSVRWSEPNEDPVTEFTGSLRALKAALPADTLVLPAHGKPFYGLHLRIDDLCVHHDEQLAAALGACADHPSTACDILPVLFKRELDPIQLMFAMGESIAHLNCLYAGGRVTRVERNHCLYFSS
ncbi:MAG: MBL fold metallo-hydrolase [Rhodanobacteraceae bacterium]